jgi:hypothetical protein
MGITRKIKDTILDSVKLFGFELVKYPRPLPLDFTGQDSELISKVMKFSLTSPERVFVLKDAVKYIVNSNIPGAIVECGVWKGGSMMAAAYTLMDYNSQERDLYLYDTYEGMPAPGVNDVSFCGEKASQLLAKEDKSVSNSIWCCADLESVKQNLFSTGYNREKMHFIKGKVEDTLPKESPREIAILRLDTDWYESTKCELTHLFPLISDGGVIILDDYGHWQGARRAVDEYLLENKINLLLNRIDYSGRIGVIYNAAKKK